MFSFLMSAHIRNSSQLTQGTVIEAAEGFPESLFLAKANSQPIVRERESEDQRSVKRQSGMMESHRWPVCMTQWKICLSECSCSEATEVFLGRA